MARQGFTGLKVGNALTELAARARVRSKPTELKLEGAAREKWLHDWLEAHEKELAPIAATMWQQLRDDPGCPEWLYPVLDEMTDPKHQLGFLVDVVGIAIGVFLNAGRLTTPFVQSALNLIWANHTDVPLTPAEAATAQIKGHIDQAHGATEAAYNGLGVDRYNILTETVGDPPGPQELMEGIRRGFINEEQFAAGIRQGLIRDEWIPFLLQLRYAPPSAAEAIQGAVQNFLDPQVAAGIVAENGIDPGNFLWMYATAGNPPGPMELITLLNRTDITLADAVQGLRESRLKDKWIPSLLQLATKFPGEWQLTQLIAKGGLTPEQGVIVAAAEGYPDFVRQAIVKAAQSTKIAKQKEIAEGMIVTAYKDGAITHDVALFEIVAFGYTEDEARFILEVADAEVQEKLENTAIASVRAGYVKHHIDDTTAQTLLGQIGIPATHAATLMELWALERTIPTRDLTATEMKNLYTGGLWDAPTYQARLEGVGYSTDDAALIVQLNTPAPPATAPSTGG